MCTSYSSFEKWLQVFGRIEINWMLFYLDKINYYIILNTVNKIKHITTRLF